MKEKQQCTEKNTKHVIRSHKWTFKKLIAFLLCFVIVINILPCTTYVEANAQSLVSSMIGSTKTSNYNGFIVEQRVTAAWESGNSDYFSIQMCIKNTQSQVIDNWTLGFDLPGKIENIWNAEIMSTSYKNDLNHYIIKNSGNNMDIMPGNQVELGFIVSYPNNSEAIILADSFIMMQGKKMVDESCYEIVANIYGNTEYNYNGYLIIKNISNNPIEDWELSFTIDCDILEFYTADNLCRNNNQYTIKNRGYNSEIKPREQIFIGFTASGEPGKSITGGISNTILYDVTIYSESYFPTPTEVVTITPTVEPTPTEVVTIIPTMEPTPTEVVTITPTMEPTPTLNIYEELFGNYTEEELFIDEDCDYLPLYAELILCTDPLNPDTDGDGLTDYIEVCNNTDPLVFTATLSGDHDSDNDGLYDCQEIYEYNTDPLFSDTDSDGLNDGFEIKYGLNPLKADSDNDGEYDNKVKIPQTIVCETETLLDYTNYVDLVGQTITMFGEELIVPDSIGAIKEVKVSTTISGDIEKNFTIKNLYGNDMILTFSPGMIGVPFDISTESEFDTAELSFSYDVNLLGNAKEENLRIAWYNEEKGLYEIFNDSYVDSEKKVVSCTTNHFSKYLVLDINELDESWRRTYAKVAQTTRERWGENTIQLCVDVGCDFFKENIEAVKNSLKRFDDARVKNSWIGSDAKQDRIGLQTISYTYRPATDPHDFEDPSSKYSQKKVSFSFNDTMSKYNIRKYTDSLLKHELACKLSGELEALKTYFSENKSDKKKLVIWLTSSTLSSSVESNVAEYLQFFKDEEIVVDMIHIDKVLDAFRDEVKTNIDSTGGILREVETASQLNGIYNVYKNKTNIDKYDVILMINSGSYPVKQMWGDVTTFISNIIKLDKIENIGFIDVYGETVAPTSETSSGAEGWYYFRHNGMIYKDSTRILGAINNQLKPEKEKCSAYYEYSFMSEYFDLYGDRPEVINKTVVMVSANAINKNSYGKYFDKAQAAGIRMFLIYVGEPISNSNTKEVMRQLFRDTGGEAYFLTDEIFSNKKNSITDKFDNAVSLVIAKTLGRTDDQDSDDDGLTDCMELNGLVLPNNIIVQTDPFDSDSDKDGLTDGIEIGAGSEKYTYKYDPDDIPSDDESGIPYGTFTYSEPITDEKDIFVVYSRLHSNPKSVDSDNDGYLDNGRNNDGLFVDKNPLIKEVFIYKINDPTTNYVPITSQTTDPKTGVTTTETTYGAWQRWFMDYGDQGDIIWNKGCGVIAASLMFLYFAMNDSSKITKDMKAYFPNIEKGVIEKDNYIKWVLNLTSKGNLMDYTTYSWFGVWENDIEKWVNSYFDREGIAGVSADYLLLSDFFTDFSIDNEAILDIICKMLNKDVPVLVEFGITRFDLLGLEFKKIPTYTKASTKTYNNNIIDQFQFDEASTTHMHWVTITEVIIDGVTGEIWLGVQTWAENRYIKLNDWLGFQMLTLWDGILVTKNKSK